MDRTVLTLAVDSTQVGTAANAFDRFVSAGNAAANSASRVTAASIAEGRAISQVLVPAINAGINRTRSLEETQRSLGQDATRQAASVRAPASFASGVVATPRAVTTGRTVPAALPSAVVPGTASFAPLAAGASAAQGAIDRLTASARNNYNALAQLTPAAESANRSFRQLSSVPIRAQAPQGFSTTAIIPSVVRQAPVSQVQPQQPVARVSATTAAGAAPSPSGMNAFSAAVTRSTEAVNELAAAEGQAGEAARQLAEANARNEAAQARLASAIARATAAQAEFDNVSRSGAGNAEAIAQAQTRLQAAQAAVSVASAAATRSQRGATEAADRHRTALNSLGRQSQLTAYQQQQLSFQLNDFFVQLASGGSPLTALIQQGSQLSGTFGGIRGTLGALRSLITPFSVGVTAAAASVGAFGYAQYEASQRTKAFKDAVVLTGNFAGQTEEQFGEMARRISDSTKTSVGSVRDMATALARTGQIGPEVFEVATEAAVRYAKTTGKAMDEVAGDVANSFAQIAKNPLQFVDDSNKNGNNVYSADDRNKVKDLQDQGKIDEAAAFALEKWNGRLKQLSGNVGDFGKLLDSVKTSASQFWDFLGNLKIPSGIQTSSAGFLGDAPIMTPTTAAMVAAEADAQRKEEQDKSKKDREKAKREAEESNVRQKGTAADERLSAFNVRANPAEGAKKARDLFEKDLKDAAASGKTYTAAQIARMRLQNTLDNADPLVLQTAQVNYSTRVQSFKDALEKEQAALAFHNQFMQGLYQSGATSVDKLYDDKVESIRKGVEAEVAELDKEKAATQQLLKSVIDPSQRLELQARIKHFDVEKDKVRQKGKYDTELTGQDREATKRALDDQVDNFRANLKQSAGDDFGAALLRAQVSERQNRILANQSGGKITAEDVKHQTELTEAAAKYADVQTKLGFVAQSASRAEEAVYLASETGGKSLLETENAIYDVRSRALEQLGKLTAQAAELAKVSTDPKVKQFAADLALTYAKAANDIDPALNRLRNANRELAAGLAQTIASAPASFADFYSQRRTQSEQDVKAQKDEYDRRIDQLRGYLAEEKDVRNKAALQKRIDQLQGERDSTKVESKGKTAIDAFKKTVLEPAALQVSNSISKVLIQDPLQDYFKNKLTAMTEGDGPLAGFFKDALGIKGDPKQQALLQQTAAIDASARAADALATAAQNAADALNQPMFGGKASSAPIANSQAQAANVINGDPSQSSPIDSELAGVGSEATQSLTEFGKQATTTASDVLKLASAAGEGGNAMGRLPGIVGLFQSAVAAMQASGSSGGGGIGGFIANLFGASGGEAASYEATAAATGIFHSGGIVGQPPVTRNVSMDLFAGAPRYHTGGIVGKAADKVGGTLKHNEVPAILMGGPKGKREEVLRADDPRHRDNLGMSMVAAILGAAKLPMLPGRGAFSSIKNADGNASPNSGASSLFRFASSAKGQMESSASILGSLFDRFGVGEGNRPEPLSGIRPRGARELGGTVSAGGMYRVNERGPELLEVAGKQYLMMGSQGGSVEPNSSKGEGRVIHQVINFHNNGPVTRQTQQQLAAAAYRGSARASSRND